MLGHPLRLFVALGLIAMALTAGVRSGSATSPASTPVFSRGMGAVLPNDGTRAQVGVSCPEHAPRACAGSVTLVPRGGTANTLGSGAIARASFRLVPGRDAQLKLPLTSSARAALKRGPLSVRAVVGPSASSRRVTVAREALYTAPGRRVVVGFASADERDYEWSWTIPKGKALAVPKFSCPDDMPRLTPGSHFLPYKRGIGGVWDAAMRVTAGDGTGYGGFDRPPLEPTPAAQALYARAEAIAAELGFALSAARVGGASDGNLTAAAGVPTLDGLGPVGDGAHARHEWVLASDLPRRAELLARLLEGGG